MEDKTKKIILGLGICIGTIVLLSLAFSNNSSVANLTEDISGIETEAITIDEIQSELDTSDMDGLEEELDDFDNIDFE